MSAYDQYSENVRSGDPHYEQLKELLNLPEWTDRMVDLYMWRNNLKEQQA